MMSGSDYNEQITKVYEEDYQSILGDNATKGGRV
jgi:hypothetical protein